ncbi:hypothetical protein SEA_BLUEFALCON_74 [Mycobacterium phage Bluefalcon]|uniref:Uncharacterized protein n=1 Tax=Mycobacterium phage Bluefalcon TaxID=2664224 RepID=A0A5Q2WFG3_9CAUD|nr:hypothetical protein KIP51_gp14 [Mycobacterium phage Bluefalcon]QGH75419.1 hypothetical protein SEA_BLUEFALCON_74 [Mycobacterium phage Bluefalcon]
MGAITMTSAIEEYVAGGKDESRKEWRRGNVERFRESVTRHFTDTPDTWKVTGGDRRYAIELPCGGKVDYFTRKRDAIEALAMGRHNYRVTYDSRTRWYLQERPDYRSRELEPWELQVIEEVIAPMRWWWAQDLQNVEVIVPAANITAAAHIAKGLGRLTGNPSLWAMGIVARPQSRDF